MNPLKILFAAAEAHPLSKVGGLADVAGSLPRALAALGHDVRLITPRHGAIDAQRFPMRLVAEAADGCRWLETALDFPAYLVDHPAYFGRPQIYGAPDDLQRYLFFCRSVAEAPGHLRWRPDVIHCHDWHAAVTPALLRSGPTASVLTIHNLAYQGWFDEGFAAQNGLAPLLPEGPERDLVRRFLGLGIYHADVISTVSRNYAREVLTPEFGEGLHPLLQTRQDRLLGITNGLDYRDFNPATDRDLPSRFDGASLEKRAPNKAALQKRANFPQDPSVPLLGMVGRLAVQKGIDIAVGAVEGLLAEGKVQFVLLGTGQEEWHRAALVLAEKFPGRAAAFIAFDDPLSRLIYGGSDLFLMPSRFEPCGLGQMIALRYGSAPVVRATGGLAETVADVGPDLAAGSGFVFREPTAEAMRTTLDRAVAAFQDRRAWRRLQKRNMALDFSWEASAHQYEELYERAVRSRKGRG